MAALARRRRPLLGGGRLDRLPGISTSVLADRTADGSAGPDFDVTYVQGIHAVAGGQFQLVVDDRPTRPAGRVNQTTYTDHPIRISNERD
jgi:hypothetical protein